MAELNVYKNPPPRIRPGQDLDAEHWVKGNYWAVVESSNVRAIRYDPVKESLFVWFLNGSVYQYERVGTGGAKAMFHADSMGKYVHQKLKGKYGAIKLK